MVLVMASHDRNTSLFCAVHPRRRTVAGCARDPVQALRSLLVACTGDSILRWTPGSPVIRQHAWISRVCIRVKPMHATYQPPTMSTSYPSQPTSYNACKRTGGPHGPSRPNAHTCIKTSLGGRRGSDRFQSTERPALGGLAKYSRGIPISWARPVVVRLQMRPLYILPCTSNKRQRILYSSLSSAIHLGSLVHTRRGYAGRAGPIESNAEPQVWPPILPSAPRLVIAGCPHRRIVGRPFGFSQDTAPNRQTTCMRCCVLSTMYISQPSQTSKLPTRLIDRNNDAWIVFVSSALTRSNSRQKMRSKPTT
ncbi:hypothetical protein H310_08731 [Aphanomyces invadans]|uniref:Uncharacterized protein n=1 Tax=Aphanomyces invadans TaxID=157072 RepID=A0A024TX61_9STRA|nr:hypothetical protein H310_08731 [Aphanomyces invadans]ETV98613.1 hypothetical protein H310_08731 [Aphanomyces invadans]|eukprot:XP_008872810.1 hypothetical protein H310_08731 [Aphanomyces invadans]